MVGPRGPWMKGFCPPTRPPTCPHERTFAAGGSSARSGMASLDAETRSAGGAPPTRVVEVDPVGERGDGGGGRDPDGRLFHAAEERPEAEPPRLGQHRPRRPDPAALRQLDVDTGNHPDEAPEVANRDRALVGDDRQIGSILKPRELVEPVRRERLLD